MGGDRGQADLRATIDPGDGSDAARLVWDPLGTSGYVDVLAETDTAEALVREYWRGARLAVFTSPSTKGAYLFDHLGNTEGVLNSAQNFAVGYLYSAWGEGLKTTGGLAQSWQFGGDWGAWREALSADLWMRARVMGSGQGSFLSTDPVLFEPDTAQYRYVRNSPTLFADPSGTQLTGAPVIAPPTVGPAPHPVIIAVMLACELIEWGRGKNDCRKVRPDLPLCPDPSYSNPADAASFTSPHDYKHKPGDIGGAQWTVFPGIVRLDCKKDKKREPDESHCPSRRPGEGSQNYCNVAVGKNPPGVPPFHIIKVTVICCPCCRGRREYQYCYVLHISNKPKVIVR